MSNPEHKSPPARNRSWEPGQKGQGGEGLSNGYGGSAGVGTGPSGPDSNQPKPSKKDEQDVREAPNPAALGEFASSKCLPTPERIAEVLR